MFGFCGACVLASNNQENNHERKESGLKYNLNPTITKGIETFYINLPYFCKEIFLVSIFLSLHYVLPQLVCIASINICNFMSYRN